MDNTLCLCGCGEVIIKRKYKSWTPKYIKGHNKRGIKFWNYRQNQRTIKCSCGCGQNLQRFDKFGNERHKINGHNGTAESRFWNKVKKSETCWIWTGAISKCSRNGRVKRPHMLFRGKTWVASRISWVLHYGEIPEGLWVLHKCDNPLCVRPDHLFVGIPIENTIDMVSKHRHKPVPT